MSGSSTKIVTGFYIALTASLLLVGGCRKKQVVMPRDPDEVRFSVVSAIKPQNAFSRAKTDENNDFTRESQIGIYATRGEEDDVRLALPENTNVGYFNPQGSTQWSIIEAGSAIRFFKDDEAMNFYAYHPFTAQPATSVTMSTTDVSPTLIYRLPNNQSTVQTLTTADLMWGKKAGVVESQGVVNLEFEHKLAKVAFKITSGEGWGAELLSVSQLEIVGTSMSETGKLHISSGTFTPGNKTTSSTYCRFAQPLALDYNNAQECQFIVIPTELTNIQIRVTAKGASSAEKTYEFTLASVVLPAGHMRQISMKIHKESSLYVNLAATIAPWDVISDIGLEGV